MEEGEGMRVNSDNRRKTRRLEARKTSIDSSGKYLEETVWSRVRFAIPGVSLLHVEGEEEQKAPNF